MSSELSLEWPKLNGFPHVVFLLNKNATASKMQRNKRYGLETIPGKKYYIHVHISASLSIKTVRVCKVVLVETIKPYGGSGG
jgi:hypothetical protein